MSTQPSTTTPIPLRPALREVLEWRRLLRTLRKHWWVALVFMGIGLAVEWGYSASQPAKHTAIGRLMVGGKMKIPEGGLYTEEWQNFFGTQMELMKSDAIRQRVLRRLQAQGPARSASPVELQISQMRRTTLFILQATGTDPAFATAYLDALMEEYINYKKEVRALSSDDTLASLTTQFLQQEKELKAQQNSLFEFQRTNSVPLLQEQAATAVLAKLNQDLAELRVEIQAVEARIAVGTAPDGPGNTAPPGSPDDNLGPYVKAAGDLSARQELQLLKYRREELSKFMRPEHPKIIRLGEEIARLEKLVSIYSEQTADQLRATRETLSLKAQNLEASIRTRQREIAEANMRLVEYGNMKVNLERVQNLYDRLLHVLQNVDLDKRVDQDSMVILDHAMLDPVDRTLLRYSLAGLLGLMLGGVVIVLIARADDRLSSLKDLRDEFREPILGLVPEVKRVRGKQGLEALAQNDRRHGFAESYRSLRSSMLVMSKLDPRPRTYMVSSAVPNEGKSSVALNLSRALAFGGARVLLVDGDLRTGELHSLLGVSEEPGLMQLPDCQSNLLACAVPTQIPNLTFIPRGRIDTDPGELFLNPKIDALLVESYAKFDYVIFDSAPVCAAADATTLAPKVDGVVFVMREGYTRAQLAREALNRLYQCRGNVVGLVVNRMKPGSPDFPFYKYPEYQPN